MNTSFVGGILLVAVGLRARRPARIPSMLLGSYMVYRGVSDYKHSEYRRKWDDRLVDEASRDSFPASDPPSWTTAGLG